MAIGTGTAIALGVAGAGMGLSAVGGMNQSKAQQKIAQEQLRFAQENRYLALNAANQQMQLSGLTPTELQAMQAQNELARNQVNQELENTQQQANILAQIDPVAAMAFQQQQELLSGKRAGILEPLMKQRDEQRASLVSNLRRQLGAGAETSTAGSMALARFDQATDQLMSQEQQNALQRLSSLGSGAIASRGQLRASGLQGMVGAQGQLGNLFQMGGTERSRQLAALSNYINAATQNQVAGYGGAGAVGALGQAQTTGNIGNMLTQLGAMGAMGGFGKFGGGMNPDAPTTPGAGVPQGNPLAGTMFE